QEWVSTLSHAPLPETTAINGPHAFLLSLLLLPLSLFFPQCQHQGLLPPLYLSFHLRECLSFSSFSLHPSLPPSLPPFLARSACCSCCPVRKRCGDTLST